MDTTRLLRGLSLLTGLAAATACDKTARPAADTPATSASSSAAAASTAKPIVAAAPMPAEAAALAKSSNTLGLALWSKAAGTGNAALSPTSIAAALAMTYGGAKGDTQAAMKKVMHVDGDPDAVMTQWGSLSRALQDPSRSLTLRIANRLFGEKTYAFLPTFVDKTKTAYGAPLEALDFKTGSEASRVHINEWVEGQTEHRIKDLLPRQALDDFTRLVLVNAIYFLADWDSPFMKTATRPAPFTALGGAVKDVPTMHQLTRYGLAQTDGAKLVELPYKGGSTAMVVALPDKVDGLAELEKKLSQSKLEAWLAALEPKTVALSLPSFEVNPSAALALATPLRDLGMAVAFDREKADFGAIATPADPRERLYIANVFHKAFVKVDEKGTEAAAATAVVMAGGGGAPPKPFEVKVDHPFLFFIVDKASGLVLFMGRVVDPAAPG